MSEKVLGFDYRKGTIGMICPFCDSEISEYDINKFNPKLFPKKLVPVCLKSESIDIKRLKEYCGRKQFFSFDSNNRHEIKGNCICVEDLLFWIEGEIGR